MKNTIKTLMLTAGLVQGGAAMALSVIFESPHRVNPYTIKTKGTSVCKALVTSTLICGVPDIRQFSATVTKTSDRKNPCQYQGSLSPKKEPVVKLVVGTCTFNKNIQNTAQVIKITLK